MAERYFQSYKVYWSVEAVPDGFKATRSLKHIENGGTSASEVYKTFDTADLAVEWAKHGS